MPVSFSSIPSNWKMPLYWIEVDPSMAGYPRSRLTSLLIGTMNSTGATAVHGVPVPVPSQADAQALFGFGSMLDGMVQFFTQNNFAQELWALPIAEATSGVAATGAITVTTPATSAGTLPVYIAGRRVQVPVAAGEVVGTTATNIAEEINDDPSMPVTAVAAAGVVTLTCKWKGIEGNEIDVRFAYGGLLAAEQIPFGLVITGPTGNKLSGGTGATDISTALPNLGDEIYEYVATGFTDSTSLALLEAEYGFSDTGRWGWLRQLYGHVFTARTGATTSDNTGYSDLLAYGPTNNSGVLSIMAFEANSPTPPWCWAAAYAAQAARALLDDPARPLQTLPLIGCLPAPKHQRFTKKQCNDLAGVGLATQGVTDAGTPGILRETTTYQLNLYGQGDDAYELVPTLATLAALFRNQRSAITTKFPRSKLADDGTRFGPGQAIVTPKAIFAELVAEYRADEYAGLVENGDAFKANLIVERDSTDPNRVNVLYPPDLINQLRIFAVLGQFRLQYNRVPL
jgi:phage tail sheath gpL-like